MKNKPITFTFRLSVCPHVRTGLVVLTSATSSRTTTLGILLADVITKAVARNLTDRKAIDTGQTLTSHISFIKLKF
jgi:hypothetical protein